MKIDDRLRMVETGLVGLIATVSALDTKIDTLSQRLDTKIDTLEQRLNVRLDTLEQRLDGLDTKLDKLLAR